MRGKALLILAAGLCASACTTTVAGSPQSAVSTPTGPAGLVSQYFNELNTAADKGPAELSNFLQRTQHPDYSGSVCDLGTITLREQPAMSTLRPDSKWKPEGSSRQPRGDVYVVAVSVSILRGGAAIGEQIGLERLVLLNGKVYGFAPCPTE